MKDVIVTVVAAALLAILFLWLLLSFLFSGWAERPPEAHETTPFDRSLVI